MTDSRNIVNLDLKKDQKILNFSDFQKQSIKFDINKLQEAYNQIIQTKKFDDGGAYRNAWIAEGQRNAPKTALDFYDAIPQVWNLRPDMRYPDPIVDLSTGRNRALASYKVRTF